MTNAEKFLKEEEAGNFVQAFSCWYYGITRELENADKMLVQFLKEQVKLTLTEDERIILKKVKSDYKYIGRKSFLGVTVLYVSQNKKAMDFTSLNAFDHLFQFIKDGEEYEIEELLNEAN